MSQTVKSVSVKIGTDTTEFIKGLKNVDKGISATVKQGNALEKSLAIKYNEKQFAEAQRVMQKALNETNKKAESIRNKMHELEKSGKIDSLDYQELNAQLIKTESSAVILENKLNNISKIKINQLSDSFKNAGKSIENVGKALLPISAIAAGIGVGIIKSGKDTLKAADDIATASDKYTMSSKAIQYWQYIAMQSDVPADRLFKASSKVRDAFGSQMTGEVNKATQTLEQLGINIKNFDSSEDAFKATVESLSAMTDKTLQAKYANDIFGEKIATDLLPLFGQGKQAIKQYNQEFEEIGYMTDEQVKAFAALDNEFNKIGEQLKQAKYELGVALLPIIKELTVFLTENVIPALRGLIEWFSQLPDGTQKAILGFVGILAIAAPLVIVVGKLIGGIGKILPLLFKLGGAIKTLGVTSKAAMAGGIAALVAAIFLIAEVAKSWGDMSGFQKVISILGILTVVALGAAIALGAFHSAATLGLAVAGIIAGIVAVTAAVNTAKKSSGVNAPDFSAPSVAGGGSGGNSYQMPDTSYLGKPQDSSSYQDNTNNSVSNFNVTVNVTEPQATANEIVDAVSKALALKFATRS